jgi:uncharacterized protein YyaL (SSP411 family)
MEHESFEDAQVAKLMNEAFVCVKVDREERPDIDNIYMSVCQAMTGSGGWPLTVLMTPDKKPFFAGTYFPKEGRFGRPGMLDLVPQISAAWKDRREDVLGSAEKITQHIRSLSGAPPGEELGEQALVDGYKQLAAQFDSTRGGFGDAPKFPMPHGLSFLLRWWKRADDPRALEMVEKTLHAMRAGGIFDHVGFGFARYSTDAEWLVPHFEKMLYDQALLTIAYVEAHQATGKAEYADVAREILTYVLRDMTAPEGGFYSAEDADSEGVEGKFYLWTLEDVRAALDEAHATAFIAAFNITDGGNFENPHTPPRTNIPHRTRPLADVAKELEVSPEQLAERLETARKTLFEVREKRIHPHKDDKILTDWNGLMIAAMARAARVLDEPKYAQAARRATDFALDKLRDDKGRLLKRYRDGEAGLPAHAEDYAFLVWGLLELYETTFDARYLQTAIDLNRDMLAHFWDEEGGGFFFAADDGEELLTRTKEAYDGAIPSANSVAMLNLLRIGRITGRTELEQRAAAIGRTFSAGVSRAPSAHAQMLSAVDFGVGPSFEIVIAGAPDAADTQAMLAAVRGLFVPNKIVLLRPPGDDAPIARIAPFTAAQAMVDGKAAAYVCQNYACERPTTEPARMVELLAGKR